MVVPSATFPGTFDLFVDLAVVLELQRRGLFRHRGLQRQGPCATSRPFRPGTTGSGRHGFRRFADRMRG